MSDEEISEEGRQARFRQWEELGLDRVKSDLVTNGGVGLIGGGSKVIELAWEWVLAKEQGPLPAKRDNPAARRQ